jgi:hypothetical protein
MPFTVYDALHADMLAHGSGPNQSSRRRGGLTIRYCPPDVEPVDRTWRGNAIHCRGKCDNPLWSLTPLPPGDSVGNGKPKIIGAN